MRLKKEPNGHKKTLEIPSKLVKIYKRKFVIFWERFGDRHFPKSASVEHQTLGQFSVHLFTFFREIQFIQFSTTHC